jgi:hypothetical protein
MSRCLQARRRQRHRPREQRPAHPESERRRGTQLTA